MNAAKPSPKTAPAATAPAPAPESDAGAAILDAALERTTARLESESDRYMRAIALAEGKHLRQGMLYAKAVEGLTAAITPEVMKAVMNLMNKPFGFLCDKPNYKDEKPYTEAEVKECFLQSLLLGFRLVGNEWNIIKKRCMGVLNGWKRKLEDVEGISDIRIAPGTPTVHLNRQVVRVALSWVRGGREDCLIGADGKPGVVFAVPSRDSDGPDALVGKAKRRAYQMAYLQATGSRQTLDLDDLIENVLPQTAAETLADRLGAGGAARPARVTEATLARLKKLFDAKGLDGDAVDAEVKKRGFRALPELSEATAALWADHLAAGDPGPARPEPEEDRDERPEDHSDGAPVGRTLWREEAAHDRARDAGRM